MDVIGLELEAARARLQAAAVAIRSVAETAPPGRVELAGPYRVVRVRTNDGGVDLVVTRERYVPRAG